MFRFFFIVSSVILLAACSTAPVTQPPPVESRELPTDNEVPQAARTTPVPAQPDNAQASPLPSEPVASVSPTEKTPAKPTNPAVLALLSDAEEFQQQGDMSAAQSRLQRAQRIAPRDPAVYYQLAQAHYQLEDYQLAEQVALKGLSFAQGNDKQLKRLWLLLADIRQQSGDDSGARTARAQAKRL